MFIGPKKKEEISLTSNLEFKDLQVRSSVVFKWLQMLKAVNPYYSDIILDTSDNMIQQLEAIPKQLIQHAHIVDQETNIVENIITSDIAGVRDDHNAENTIESFSNLLLTYRNAQQLNQQTSIDSNNLILKSTDKAINQDSPLFVTRHSNVAINEFNENQIIMYGAFPHLFPFGRGYGSTSLLNSHQTKHLLKQYSNRFSQDSRLLFTLFDQLQRHTTAQTVSMRVKNNPGSFDKFSELIQSTEFKSKVASAVKDPNTSDAKKIVNAIIPYINLIGGKVPYGPIERSTSITKLYALTFRYGVPSIFLTIAPDDIHNILVLRLCIPSTTNKNFPAEENDLLIHLRQNSTEFEIPIQESDLYNYVTSNPVASAQIFQRIMDCVFSILIGILILFICFMKGMPIENGAIKKTTPMQENKGVFGAVAAIYAAIETSARLALHSHMAIWGSYPPHLLQKVAAFPELVETLSNALNSMFLAEIPVNAHLNGILNRKENKKSERFAFSSCPNIMNNNDDYNIRLHSLIDTVQIHSHKPTCHKGKYGKTGCRLSKPSGFIPQTSCVQLIQPQTKDAKYEVQNEIDHPKIEETRQRNHQSHPLPNDDKRNIYWEIKRPIQTVESIKSFSNEYINRIENQDQNFQSNILSMLKRRNGVIVEVNDVCSQALNCNSAAYILGGQEQAKAVLFYLLKYITKDSVELTSTISVLSEAQKHIEKHPSQAIDNDTNTRYGKYFLERIVNNLCGMMEVSDTQAASALIDMPSTLTTTNFQYCFIYPAINNVKTSISILTSTEIFNNEENEIEKDQQQSEFDSESEEGEGFNINLVEESGINSKYGSAVVYSSSGKLIPVAQHTHYRYRGPDLQFLNLYEYVSIISIVPIDQKNKMDDTTSHAGRKSNATFRFTDDHQLSKTHVQRIRSKQECPILANGSPPHYPGPQTKLPSETWIKQSNRYAEYMMVLFSPWSENGIPELGTTWKDFCRMIEILDEEIDGKPSFIAQGRMKCIENITRNLRVNPKRKKLMVQYRNRNATIWNNKDFDEDFVTYEQESPFEDNEFTRQSIEAAEEEIKRIQEDAESLTSDMNQRNIDIELIHYLQQTTQNFDSIFKNDTIHSTGNIQINSDDVLYQNQTTDKLKKMIEKLKENIIDHQCNSLQLFLTK